MAPYVARLLQSFIALLGHDVETGGLGGSAAGSDAVPATLLENVAITVGRLGLTNTAQLAACLPEYLEAWCLALRHTRASHEKVPFTHARTHPPSLPSWSSWQRP